MARILITSGPTRQYLDPVRYLTNASSGRMGRALAAAAISMGHEVVVVSGPVAIDYPPEARVIPVITTEEMLDACRQQFGSCDGIIGVAAPCDYRPKAVRDQKIMKTGGPLTLELHETPDIIATIGLDKADKWVVGFALETDDQHFRAITKLEKKRCNLIVLNGPAAIDSNEIAVEIINHDGHVVRQIRGRKDDVGMEIMQVIQQQLIAKRRSGAVESHTN